MDLYQWGFSGSEDRCVSGHESVSAYSDPNLITGFQLKDMNRDYEFVNLLPTSNDPVPPIHSTVLSDSWSGDSAEEFDFCDSVLKYINEVLMEDDMEDKASVIQDSTLQAAEKYFHDILNERYHSSPHLVRPQEETSRCQCCSSYSSSSDDANSPVKSSVIRSPHVHHSPFVHQAFQTNLPPVSSTSFSSHYVSNAPSESQSSWQFHGGIENAKNIIPGESGVTFNCENRFVSPAKESVWQMKAKLEKEEGNCPESLLRGRKSLHREGSALDEGRSHKHLAVDVGESILHEIFDKVLSFDESAIHTSDGDLPTEAGGKRQQCERAKVYDDEMTYTKKGVTKREALDTRKLLIQCMQSVASNDQTTATKLLKQIRLRSCPQGDASQRLAHYFANGLEARLTSSRIPKEKLFSIKGFVGADVWKAHKLYVSAFPFLGISYFIATQIIMELAEKVTSLHIIHFGIILGLQWPPLIRRLSERPGGPPKLRITAIDLPQIGFRPDARIKETGQRLATYCEKFKVPFEYNGFGQKWETVLVEDLRIQKDELLVVNSLNQLQDLLDDSIMDHSPRDAVLNLIRRINPDLFIHGVVNGTYNSPFFISRFREALFHFSAWFDMLDANVPRDNKERMALERDQWGKEILNIIACEGLDRVERPETYKQWEIRTLRAGFRQMPLNQEILKEVRAKVRSSYPKEFFVDKANKWIVTGWKGRPFFAISSWKPA
ncbi:scarecrow-like protein 34 [Diospyros lotus]|uniref:scarecrow-like protein 34 n=1 Tax=Diospyros lotus TaxID=55363 RepID=UPI00224F0767|nr:scarecrow-like protein 34 [Diospyros lotus]XP_052185987.1 scarecrow-like protein 34 [Diospyros lotus]XP_052185988.1 scarecrow-like protein 34 [Diospyros lotus]XP_052185989.1 scarecrow-like protein 34 [Diospyros lotus]XP_052185990.1 scarecrow-like protein 34 [Diospyros lotus]XP_052185991.1 scarecrow-like protein 34 [Diospyros lotus]